jgi:hypothetical protein
MIIVGSNHPGCVAVDLEAELLNVLNLLLVDRNERCVLHR